MGFRSSTRARLSAIVLLSAMVAACGGGDGEVSAPPPPPSAPVPPPPASQLLDWDVHPAASVVLGQDGPDSDTAGDLSFALGSPAVTENGHLYVVTEGTLKEFGNYTAGGATAQRTHLFANGANNVFVRGNTFVMTDDAAVYIYKNGMAGGVDADVYSSGTFDCGPSAMNAPQSALLTPAGHLIVADTGNNRVLIWNPDIMPASGPLPEPSVVVGQRNMESCLSNETGDSGPNDSTLSGPRAVWSDGTRLVVADSENNRLLIWDRIPGDDFQPANHVVGQADFNGQFENRDGTPSEFTLCNPQSVDVNSFGQMAVADSCNHRVLVWDAVPGLDSAPANHVLGKNTFADDSEPTAPSARNLRFPTGARFHDRNLIVVDHGHSRVLVFPASN